MKKILFSLLALALTAPAAAQYQVGNSDFETTWSSDNEPGNGWYSFPSATGDYAKKHSLTYQNPHAHLLMVVTAEKLFS